MYKTQGGVDINIKMKLIRHGIEASLYQVSTGGESRSNPPAHKSLPRVKIIKHEVSYHPTHKIGGTWIRFVTRK